MVLLLNEQDKQQLLSLPPKTITAFWFSLILRVELPFGNANVSFIVSYPQAVQQIYVGDQRLAGNTLLV